MKKTNKPGKQTTVGVIDPDVLAFTAGEDVALDHALVEADCLGSAAHVMMLARLPLKPKLFTAAERDQLLAGLADIVHQAVAGQFEITLEDQDVHLAIERCLTRRFGDLGKRIHTGRSRNDQVATALRLYTRRQLSLAVRETAILAKALLTFARRHEFIPMVGRTHLQPAMPSSVGLWAAHFAESLLDDAQLLINAYELTDQCPLGAAASYGVPLPLDREYVSRLLGFKRPTQTVLYAVSARGKLESVALAALGQAMISLSRLAEDVILFSMPEFGYFSLPAPYCTGSSIMPQKQNPDVLELVRAKTSRVLADMNAVMGILKNLPSGYNRDVQETKEPLMKGLDNTRASLRIMARLVGGLRVCPDALRIAFEPSVFATDWALKLVAGGMPFRDAYQHVKDNLDTLLVMDPRQAVRAKTSLGATGRLELPALLSRMQDFERWALLRIREHERVRRRLLGDHPQDAGRA